MYGQRFCAPVAYCSDGSIVFVVGFDASVDGQLAIQMLSVTSQPGCCKSRKLHFVPF